MVMASSAQETLVHEEKKLTIPRAQEQLRLLIRMQAMWADALT
jgi:hypothetical protein